MSSLLIETILKTHKITDYLKSKGLSPSAAERGGKIFYNCPLHEGDSTPSFVVYTNSGEYENFYCFGCKAKYNIIHLYRDFEKVTLGQAIKALSNGMKLDNEAELLHATQQIQNDKSVEAQYTPDDLALMIARQLYDFQKIVENDPECIASCEKISQAVDKCVTECDLQSLHRLNEMLPDVLPQRVMLFQQQKERNIMRQVEGENK